MPFVTAGDPDLATTREVLLALRDAGVDLIELGFPYSDPIADGPVIPAGSSEAGSATCSWLQLNTLQDQPGSEREHHWSL